jgi:2-polyprenyl-6-methoxyphenol hydroxylase-like FAD-dependent oxidoreductase
MNQDQHVLIAGAGIGGLALAQGLRQAGIRCSVFERASAPAWGGYILHMNADGGAALRTCLPKQLYNLYVATSRRSPRRDVVVVLDHLATEITTLPHHGPANDTTTPHTSVHRGTLCQILLGGITGNIHFDHEVTGYHHDGDTVIAEFAGGGSARGSILIGADGINSAIRHQLLPDVEILPIANHALLSQAPLTSDLAASLPAAFKDSFIMMRDPAGTHLATGLFQPRQPAADAAADLAPDITVEPVADYVAVSMELAKPELGNHDFFTAPKRFLHSLMREAATGWHPALRQLIAGVAAETIVPRTIRMLSPARPWCPGNVTLLGDAIHAMPPMFGNGANSALVDAAELTTILASGPPTPESIAQYESNMRARTFPLLERAMATQ